MARAAIPLSVDESKKAIRHIFPQLGGVNFSDGLMQSRRLKWMHTDTVMMKKISTELDKLGISHQLIIPDPRAWNAWRGTAITIYVSKALNYREAVTGLVNPLKVKQPKRTARFLTLEQKHKILAKLLPYVSKDDIDLNTIELVQQLHDRVKEDLS